MVCQNLFLSLKFFPQLWRMGSRNLCDHLSVTLDSSRQPSESHGNVTEIVDVSPTVKKLTLSLHEAESVSFKAGQWVDFVIPSVETVGGFSICSTPSLLKKHGAMVLAVKYSEHPPAKWVHTKCRPGDDVRVKIGGDFWFDPDAVASSLSDHALLLVAGGLGINPLFSILATAAESTTPPPRIFLLYSAKSSSEFIFRREIDEIAAGSANVEARFFCSRETRPVDATEGRVDAATIASLFKGGAKDVLEPEKCRAYVCGPSRMTDAVVVALKGEGVASDQIFFEKWW